MSYITSIFIGGCIIYLLYLIRLGIFKYQYGESMAPLLLICQEIFNRYKSHEFSALILAQSVMTSEQLNKYRDTYIRNVLLSLSPVYKRWLLRYFLSSEGLITFISSVFDSLVRKNDLLRAMPMPTTLGVSEKE
jgi:hypothetical protein